MTPQRKCLEEFRSRIRRLRAFGDTEVHSQLQLTGDQREQIGAILRAGRESLAELQKTTLEKATAVLTDGQDTEGEQQGTGGGAGMKERRTVGQGRGEGPGIRERPMGGTGTGGGPGMRGRPMGGPGTGGGPGMRGRPMGGPGTGGGPGMRGGPMGGRGRGGGPGMRGCAMGGSGLGGGAGI